MGEVQSKQNSDSDNTSSSKSTSTSSSGNDLKDISAILFSNTNYQGNPIPIMGSRDVPWTEDIGFPNDALSSLLVSDGYSVTLFSDSGYKGDSKTYKGPVQAPTLDPIIDKKTSSLKVYKTGTSLVETGNGMTLFLIILIVLIVIIGFILYNRNKSS